MLVLIDAKLNDPKLRELIAGHGIGYHHAGLDSKDRHTVESLFLKGDLLVLRNSIFLVIIFKILYSIINLNIFKYAQAR
jgi:hypothetical protein